MFDDEPAVRARLDEDLVAWMTTTAPDGQPQPSLVWFVVEGEDIVVYSKERTPRLRNIEAVPRVSLNLNSDRHGASPIIIEGEARIVGRQPRFDEDAAYYGKYVAHLDRWDFSVESYARDFPIRIHVRPTRLRTS